MPYDANNDRYVLATAEPTTKPMETFTQPKIKGYRQLSEEEAGLMNEVKILGQHFEDLIGRLKAYHGVQRFRSNHPGAEAELEKARLSIAEPERWLAMGRTDIQTGVMAICRSIAQPTA